MKSNLKNGRDTNRCGYMSTINDSLENQSTPVLKKSAEPVDPDAIRSSRNAVANCIWNMSDIAEYMNAGAIFIKQLLKGFGCSDNKLSPFAKVKWEKTDHCLQKLHQLLRQYRSNANGDGDKDITSTITSDLLDLEEEERLQELLHEENSPHDNDLADIQCINPVACLDDDSSIDSIDDLENLVVHDDGKIQSVDTHIADDLYHCVMWKTLSSKSSIEAMSFVPLIAEAMSELGMRQRERGVDSTDTKQKTLILQWMADRTPANIQSLSQDEKLLRNVVVKLFNKKGKSKIPKEQRKKRKKRKI